jgi:pyruvate dehydrogenase E1 component
MLDQIGLDTTQTRHPAEEARLLAEVERKVLWLSAWMIHHANHLRPSADGLKVGGHQASSASIATIMTALYFAVLRPQDRVAVKPHASPVFHAIQYLLGNQTREKMEAFRALGGAQSYPSRTKDVDDVDFSTGSVGLGAAQTIFASLVQDYVRLHGWGDGTPEGRMVALVGDAEMDEGNIYEALLEGSRHGLRNTWWVIDYNRQSLDAVIGEGVNDKIMGAFTTMGWEVVELKYGRLLQAAFAEPGGTRLRDWIDACPNQLYSALVFRGGAAWRERLLEDLGDQGDVSALLARRSDDELARLMTNLGGHDLGLLLDAFRSIDHDRPVCFLAYTIKGFGLPLAGHKDNHAGLMNPAQMDAWRAGMGIRPGHEWDIAEGLGITEAELRDFLARVPFNARGPRRTTAPALPVPETLAIERQAQASTQAGFGQLMHALARSDAPIADRIVTTSPDVTVSTNLGAWVGRRGLFAQEARRDVFREAKIPSAYRWEAGPHGQHVELGIAEMNLFLMLSALGLSHSIFGERLIPVGTLYDPFIARGLDAMNYACYQDARFILAATPSGITLAPEGGADRHGAARPVLLRAGLRGRARRHPALGAGACAAGWQRGWLGLPPPVHAQYRAAAARHRAGAGRGHRRRRLLAAPARAELRGRHRLLRRRGAGSDRRGWPARGTSPRCRRAGRHLPRPALRRLARGRGRTHGRRHPRAEPCGAAAAPPAAPLLPGDGDRRAPRRPRLARFGRGSPREGAWCRRLRAEREHRRALRHLRPRHRGDPARGPGRQPGVPVAGVKAAAAQSSAVWRPASWPATRPSATAASSPLPER